MNKIKKLLRSGLGGVALFVLAPCGIQAALLYDLSFDPNGTLRNFGSTGGMASFVSVNGSIPVAVTGGVSSTYAMSFPMAAGGISGGRVDLPSSGGTLGMATNGSQITISLWIKWTGPDNHSFTEQGLVSKLSPSQTTGWAFCIRADGKLEFNLGGVGRRVSVGSVPLNQWTHVAATYQVGSGTNIAFYINGASAGVDDPYFTGSGTTNTINIFLGNIDGTYLPTNGRMDEVRLYDHILTPAEIGKLATPGHEQTKKVFAHYMVCNRSYGGTVAGYKRDIQEAQSYGVDGFALNVGEWNSGGNYKTDVASIFQAAQELNTDFMLFFSADMSQIISGPEIIDMMTTYAGRPNYFRYNNRPFLSTFSGEMTANQAAANWWKDNVINPLNAAGYNVYFIPFFYTSDKAETPTYSNVLSNYNAWWKDVVNGFFYFGAAGLPANLNISGEACAKVLHDNNRQYMGVITPQYWGSKQPGRRYFEYQGGEGIASQWQSILATQKPEWIEMVTWNDFDEATYLSPIDDVVKYWPYTDHTTLGFYKSHAGLMALTKYYIDWYKFYPATQCPPPPGYLDNIFWFYRTHPQGLAAPSDPRGPVTERHPAVVEDKIYVTTILNLPAELRVTSGGVVHSYNLPAGITHTRIPFATGAQRFELYRGGVRKGVADGDVINSSISAYNFHYTSGVLQAPPW